jgi:hypothetical protein
MFLIFLVTLFSYLSTIKVLSAEQEEGEAKGQTTLCGFHGNNQNKSLI